MRARAAAAFLNSQVLLPLLRQNCTLRLTGQMLFSVVDITLVMVLVMYCCSLVLYRWRSKRSQHHSHAPMMGALLSSSKADSSSSSKADSSLSQQKMHSAYMLRRAQYTSVINSLAYLHQHPMRPAGLLPR
jgi:hypothetical protein